MCVVQGYGGKKGVQWLAPRAQKPRHSRGFGRSVGCGSVDEGSTVAVWMEKWAAAVWVWVWGDGERGARACAPTARSIRGMIKPGIAAITAERIQHAGIPLCMAVSAIKSPHRRSKRTAVTTTHTATSHRRPHMLQMVVSVIKPSTRTVSYVQMLFQQGHAADGVVSRGRPFYFVSHTWSRYECGYKCGA
eukprot:365877-Chlamydomonas_euryale.AAC.8